MISKDAVMQALSTVREPELGRDLVSLKMIEDLAIEGGKVRVAVTLTTPACPLKAEIKRSVEEAVRRVPGVEEVDVNLRSHVTTGSRERGEDLIPQVKNVIAVSSGKGGVGKTTVAVNLAVALAQEGARVGILDADIHGPNVPMMMGIKVPPQPVGEKLPAADAYGVKVMSMGFLVPEDTPVVWRGPMLHGIIQQFLRDVEWGELDYLVVDLPPGTGDAQLSICQLVPVTGAVIVTTPQDVAILDSRKGLAMFQKANVPILGIVENMSYFVCPHCKEQTEIFSRGGGKKASERLGVPFLGEVPIDTAIRVGGDQGTPIVVSDPESPQSEAFRKLARTLAAQISMQNYAASHKIQLVVR